MMLKFYFNGIKENGGKLQRCFYSDGQLVNYPAGTITIYGRDYTHFSAEIYAEFDTSNDSDYQTDYVTQDIVRVKPDHPRYHEVHNALYAAKEHNAKTASKRQARYTKAQQVERAAA